MIAAMVVLGLDPGLRITGYAVLASSVDRQRQRLLPTIVDAGVIRPGTGSLAERIARLYADAAAVIVEHTPQLVAIEKLYSHYQHPRTAILMAHGRGVLLLAAQLASVPVVDLPSTLVKRRVTGFGHAGKAQITRAVASLFDLPMAGQPPDVYDAIAVALTAWANAVGTKASVGASAGATPSAGGAKPRAGSHRRPPR